jgi:hypothetical protein
MVIALASLLVCGFMFAIYRIVRREERRLEGRRPAATPPAQTPRWRQLRLSLRGWF